jgi:hypothetical protein
VITRDRLEKMDDVDIDRIIITNDFGLEFDLTNFITTLGFYESVFNPFIVGELVLEDGQDLMTNLSLVGREKITIKFKTPAIDSDIREITLRVIGQKSKLIPNKSKAYIVNLRLVSENYFVNQTTKESVSFRGKPHQIVEKITSEYLPGDLITNETTNDGDYKIAYAFKQPLQMITQIMTTATPTDSSNPERDAGYLFYETLDGLNFRCFNNMFKASPTYTFFNSNTLRSSSEDDEFTKSTFFAEKVVFGDTSNRVKQIENGSFASKTYFHDLTTKQWGQSTFNYGKENNVKEKNTKTNKTEPIMPASLTSRGFNNSGVVSTEMFPVISENQLENTEIQKVFFSPRHTNVQGEEFKANENNYETIKFSNSNLALYNDTEIDLTLSGNSLLRAGQTVNFMVQRNEPDSKLQSAASDFNPEKSGRYLISAIHHRFFLVTGTHKTYATLIRNFRGQAVPQQQEKVEIT